MNKIYLVPSVYAHIMNGILLLVALFILCKNYSKLITVEPYKILMLVLLLSISIGIHGLSHLGLEQQYNYNPIDLVT